MFSAWFADVLNVVVDDVVIIDVVVVVAVVVESSLQSSNWIQTPQMKEIE